MISISNGVCNSTISHVLLAVCLDSLKVSLQFNILDILQIKVLGHTGKAPVPVSSQLRRPEHSAREYEACVCSTALAHCSKYRRCESELAIASAQL